MQTIPTRIADAHLVRHKPSRRPDGSQLLEVSPWGPSQTLAHEEQVTADFGFTCEPHYTLSALQRSFRCLEGEVYVCIVDVRLGSRTFGHWQGIFLNQDDARTLCIPAGVACGWQVLSNRAAMEHRSSQPSRQTEWHWLQWNDPELDIEWPESPQQFARHRRPGRDLAQIPDHRLPSLTRARNKLVRESSRSTSRNESNSSPRPKRRSRKLTPQQKMSAAKPAAPAIGPVADTTPPHTETSQVNKPRASKNNVILVIGSSGGLGRDLCRHLRTIGTVLGACRTIDVGSLLPVPVFVDVSRPASIRQAVRQIRPKLIVNASGLTDVDQAEMEPRLAQLVNATAPTVIADEAKRLGAGVVHFCTGMVFDGSGERPWRESDTPHAINHYARTKWIGTQAVIQSEVPHLILRAGWLYATHGDNYIRRTMDLLTYRNNLALASDHFGTPTSTDWLARTIAQILAAAHGDFADWLAEHGGLYHAAPLGYASKTEVGDQILATCRQHALPIVLQSIQPRRLSELPSRAMLPANCRLDPSRLAMQFNLTLPRWQQQLNERIAIMLEDRQCLPVRSVA